MSIFIGNPNKHFKKHFQSQFQCNAIFHRFPSKIHDFCVQKHIPYKLNFFCFVKEHLTCLHFTRKVPRKITFPKKFRHLGINENSWNTITNKSVLNFTLRMIVYFIQINETVCKSVLRTLRVSCLLISSSQELSRIIKTSWGALDKKNIWFDFTHIYTVKISCLNAAPSMSENGRWQK